MITVICVLLFVAVGYYYINSNLVKTETEPIEKVPYYQEKPENAGVLIDILGDKTYIYFDFENSKIASVLFLEDKDIEGNEIYGYPIDYNLETNVDFVANLVDYLSGIELDLNGEILRYTGVQIAEIIMKDQDKIYKKEIFQNIIKQISIKGIGNDFIMDSQENINTNITVPQFYYWCDNIKGIADNLLVVDS